MIKCPHCATELPDFSRFCSRCGRNIEAAVGAKSSSDPRVCNACGAMNARGMDKCGACGASLEEAAADAYAPHPFPVPADAAASARQARYRCPRCGAALADASRCESCGWAELSVSRERRGLTPALNIASILLIGAGLASLSSIVLSLIQLSDPQTFEGAGFTSEIVDIVEDVVACCLVIGGAATVFSFLTAYMLRSGKGSFMLCLAGAGIAILGVGPYYIASGMALIALILIAISGEEFG